MRAISYDRFGGTDVLSLREIDAPPAGPDTVLVRTRSAGLNPVDYKVRQGALQGGFATHFPVVPGWDVAGVVEAVGPAVSEFAVGDEVVGYVRRDDIQWGTLAELVAAPVRTLAPKPRTASWDEAGGLPLAGLTAYQALERALHVGPGDTLLVHAASGGVGTMAVQLAVAKGATVIGTCGERNDEHVRSLGATPVRYGDGLVERVREVAPGGITAALDLAGRGAVPASVQLMDDPTRIASVIDPGEVHNVGGHYVFVRPDAVDLAALSSMVDAGTLRVHVSATHALEDAAAAYDELEGGAGPGKVVVQVSQG